MLGQQVVGLGHAVGPEVAGGEEVQRLVGGQLGVEPLRQEGGVAVRVVVQAVPNGGLRGTYVCQIAYSLHFSRSSHSYVEYHTRKLKNCSIMKGAFEAVKRAKSYKIKRNALKLKVSIMLILQKYLQRLSLAVPESAPRRAA